MFVTLRVRRAYRCYSSARYASERAYTYDTRFVVESERCWQRGGDTLLRGSSMLLYATVIFMMPLAMLLFFAAARCLLCYFAAFCLFVVGYELR